METYVEELEARRERGGYATPAKPGQARPLSYQRLIKYVGGVKKSVWASFLSALFSGQKSSAALRVHGHFGILTLFSPPAQEAILGQNGEKVTKTPTWRANGPARQVRASRCPPPALSAPSLAVTAILAGEGHTPS